MGQNGFECGFVHSGHTRAVVLAGKSCDVDLEGDWAHGWTEVKHTSLEKKTWIRKPRSAFGKYLIIRSTVGVVVAPLSSRLINTRACEISK